MTEPDRQIQRTYRFRILALLFVALVVLAATFVAWQVAGTLQRLDVVERERDTWQRPADVIRALAVQNDSTAVDLGCGSGYFTLRLSAAAGRVVAEDIRRLPLLFLRLRVWLRDRHNIVILRGTPDDPGLGSGRSDAVLIANTYHEFDHPRVILAQVRQALRPGGRLVILDRQPDLNEPAHHEIALSQVEHDVRDAGFKVLGRDERFIERPANDTWWLLIANKP